MPRSTSSAPVTFRWATCRTIWTTLPKESTIVTQCASGYRSQIAASLLQAAGFENVITLNEGDECWSKFLPTESGVVLERVVA